jgi:hypothetical protein
MSNCAQCGTLLKRHSAVYCSNQCQNDYEYERYIALWKQAKVAGGRGILTKNISGHVKRYLFSKFGDACSLCGWNMINPTTKRVPLEIDHIDGNSENNCEENLRVICPNCHALTLNYKNLNYGKGRDWRRLKYLKNDK